LIVIASPFEVEKTQPCYHESDYPYEDRAKPSIQEGFFLRDIYCSNKSLSMHFWNIGKKKKACWYIAVPDE
jgi:hypothetical protein